MAEGWRKAYKAKIKAFVASEKLKCGCELCGYNRTSRALDYHHINPSLKKKDVHSCRSFLRVIKEMNKCVLLCANCHREVHDGLHIDEVFEIAAKKGLSVEAEKPVDDKPQQTKLFVV